MLHIFMSTHALSVESGRDQAALPGLPCHREDIHNLSVAWREVHHIDEPGIGNCSCLRSLTQSTTIPTNTNRHNLTNPSQEHDVLQPPK